MKPFIEHVFDWDEATATCYLPFPPGFTPSDYEAYAREALRAEYAVLVAIVDEQGVETAFERPPCQLGDGRAG